MKTKTITTIELSKDKRSAKAVLRFTATSSITGDQLKLTYTKNLSANAPLTQQRVIKLIESHPSEGPAKAKCHDCAFHATIPFKPGDIDFEYDGPTKSVYDLFRCHNDSFKICAGLAHATGLQPEIVKE